MYSGILRYNLSYTKLENDNYGLSNRNVNAYTESLRMLEKQEILNFLSNRENPEVKKNLKAKKV